MLVGIGELEGLGCNMFGRFFRNKEIFSGSLIPIVKCIKFKNNLNENIVKKQVINRMIPELERYVVWSIDEDGDVKKITGRIDVLHRDNIN